MLGLGYGVIIKIVNYIENKLKDNVSEEYKKALQDIHNFIVNEFEKSKIN